MTQQQSLDFSSQSDDRWRLLRSLDIGRGDAATRVRLLLEIVAGVAGDGELTWTIEALAERLSAFPGTARKTVAMAKACGLIVVRRTRTRDSQLSRNAIAVDWQAIRGRQYTPVGRQSSGRRTPLPQDGAPAPTNGAQLPQHGPPLPTNGAPAPTNAPIVPPESLVPSGRPAGGNWTEPERGEIEKALRRCGYDQTVAARLACESETKLGLTAAAVLEVCETFLAQRQLFRRAGAIGYRLRQGSWPVDGVIPIAQIKQGAESRQSRSDAQTHETELCRIVKEGRQKGVEEAVIRDRLRHELPVEFCESKGW